MTSSSFVPSRAHELAEELRHELLRQGLQEGDVFMTEADICQRYGVSRSIAREAVSRLRGLGILKSRQGKGLLIGKSDSVALIAMTLPFSSGSPAAREELGHLRYVLELGAIDLAIANASDAQLQRLQEIAEEYERISLTNSPEADGRVELAFHTLILEMTGIPLVANMHQVIAQYFHSSAPEQLTSSPQSVWDHRAIAEAFARRDVELARSLLRRHLQGLIGRSSD